MVTTRKRYNPYPLVCETCGRRVSYRDIEVGVARLVLSHAERHGGPWSEAAEHVDDCENVLLHDLRAKATLRAPITDLLTPPATEEGAS